MIRDSLDEAAKGSLKRDALLRRLAHSRLPNDLFSKALVDRVVEVLGQNVEEGNFTAAKYVFDQLAGQPRATVVYEIADADLLETISAVTAEFIGPDQYDEWWGRVKGALEKT